MKYDLALNILDIVSFQSAYSLCAYLKSLPIKRIYMFY